jgi:hypothetical protein
MQLQLTLTRLSLFIIVYHYMFRPFITCTQVKEDEMGRICSTNGEKMNAYRIFVGKPEGRRPLGRPRRRWVDNIKMDLRDIGWSIWTGSIWLRIGTSGGLL